MEMIFIASALFIWYACIRAIFYFWSRWRTILLLVYVEILGLFMFRFVLQSNCPRQVIFGLYKVRWWRMKIDFVLRLTLNTLHAGRLCSWWRFRLAGYKSTSSNPMFKSVFTGFENSAHSSEPTKSCPKVSETTACIIRVLVVGSVGVLIKLTCGLIVACKSQVKSYKQRE